MHGLSESSKRSGRVFKTVLSLAVFIGAALTLFWMLLLPHYVKLELESRTEFKVTFDSLAANPFTMRLQARDVRIFNSDAFEGNHFCDIESLDLVLKYPSGEDASWSCKNLQIKGAHLTLTVGENGKSNLRVFDDQLFGLSDQSSEASFSRIENAEIEIETLEVIDYSRLFPRKERVRIGRTFQLEYARSLSHALSEVFSEARRLGYSIPASAISGIRG